ncbi:RNA polymerase sigma-70 factor [Flammeovirgaceae bacterium SG7u.111]|nr:RNA polymerase sigma-70 factor [Flammeovirgaceae bacterium SG7u.132]WPO35026.1 RNA polymerase sigma-70 factor [Flammeovirgaceae bacterium SG7u.111]
MENSKVYLSDLLNKLVEGKDERARKELFVLFYQRLVAFAYTFIKSIETAKDIVSEVFTKIYTNPQKLAGVKDLEPYLLRAVKNSSLNYLKSSACKNKVDIEDDDYFISFLWEYRTPESTYGFNELQSLVEQTVNGFPHRRKMIYHLIVDRGMKYNEVAELLDISSKTVNNQLVTAVKTLREKVSSYMKEEIAISG